jgi:hypothetical protein
MDAELHKRTVNSFPAFVNWILMNYFGLPLTPAVSW